MDATASQDERPSASKPPIVTVTAQAVRASAKVVRAADIRAIPGLSLEGEHPPSASHAWSASSWQAQMQGAIRSPAALLAAVATPLSAQADPSDPGSPALPGGELPHFPLLVPQSFAARIEPGNPRDPILRQVAVSDAEWEQSPGFTFDPVEDAASMRAPGMLQKYDGRALLVVTGQCAVHCRYCFRRSYPYDTTPRSDAAWRPALEALNADASLREIILSGGDPLTLSDERLGRLVAELASISHLVRLRVHTRVPIVLPARVTEALLAWLVGTRLTPIMVVHANHAQEINDEVAAALALLRSAGVLLFNQAVLLAGVNDSADAQVALCERLVETGVAPYYLHQLDRAAGAAHFETPVALGRQIMAELQRRLPGYAVPRYVVETPGASSKEWLYP